MWAYIYQLLALKGQDVFGFKFSQGNKMLVVVFCLKFVLM